MCASAHAGRNYSHTAAYCRRVAELNRRRYICNAEEKDPSLISPLRDRINLEKSNNYRNLSFQTQTRRIKIRANPYNSPSVPDWKTDRSDGDACGGEDNVQSDSHELPVEPWCQHIRQCSHRKQAGALQQKGDLPLNFSVHVCACMRVTLRQPPCLEYSVRERLAPCLHKQ